jgi:hypothetical protein
MVPLLIELTENFCIFLYNMVLHYSAEVPRRVILIVLDPQASMFYPAKPIYNA